MLSAAKRISASPRIRKLALSDKAFFTTRSHGTRYGRPTTSTLGLGIATAASILAAGAYAYPFAAGLLGGLTPEHLYALETTSDSSGNPSDDRREDEHIHCRDGGAQENSDSNDDAAFNNLHTLLTLPKSYTTRVVVDGNLYTSCMALSPDESDKTGIVHLAWAYYCRQVPAHCLTSFIATNSHTITQTIMVQGSQPSEIGNMLGEAIILAAKDAIQSYAAHDDTRAQAYSSEGDGALCLETLGLGNVAATVEEYNPDIVRPIAPPEEIARAIKRAFIGVDYCMVYANADEIFRLARAQRSGARAIKAQGVLNSTAATAGPTTALVGFYEGDTRVYTVALVGDARAVLGRPVQNASRSTTSVPLESPSPPPTEPGANIDLPSFKRSDYATLYSTVSLTSDQVPTNSSEVARLEALHPGKKLFVGYKNKSRGKTYLGLPVTRAFGVGPLKWSIDLQRCVEEEFLGVPPADFFLDGSLPGPPGSGPGDLPPRGPSPATSPLFPSKYKSPSNPSPDKIYLTAEPELTTVRVKSGDFIVLGTRGLFECLSSEEVVGLVAIWLQERQRKIPEDSLRNFRTFQLRDPRRPPGTVQNISTDEFARRLMRDVQNLGSFDPQSTSTILKAVEEYGKPRQRRLVDRNELPIVSSSSESLSLAGDAELAKLAESNERLNANRKPFRYPVSWKEPNHAFVFDERDQNNVAVHVIRNALGGQREDLTEALMSTNANQASKLMDDVGLTVIFFE